MLYESEEEMSLYFERYISRKFGTTYLKEVEGLFGIPDYVFYTNHKDPEKISVISFELKLKNWKKALHQAFRYRSFSHVSYVVISPDGESAALKNKAIFEKYNIGLAVYRTKSNLDVLVKPSPSKPFSLKLQKKTIALVQGKRRKTKKEIASLIS
ncbi:hypothetical protein AB3N62_12875 [Leptospira sp. WS4.C2]